MPHGKDNLLSWLGAFLTTLDSFWPSPGKQSRRHLQNKGLVKSYQVEKNSPVKLEDFSTGGGLTRIFTSRVVAHPSSSALWFWLGSGSGFFGLSRIASSLIQMHLANIPGKKKHKRKAFPSKQKESSPVNRRQALYDHTKIFLNQVSQICECLVNKRKAH